MRSKVATSDSVVAEFASRQHGVVATWQLRAAGLSSAGIARRASAGRLQPLHRGVYAVGYPSPSPESRWMAAVLACGNLGDRGDDEARSSAMTIVERWGAALSHRAAAGLWGLLEPGEGPVDVSVPGDGGRAKRRGIRLHRCPSLSPRDVTLHRGIPTTTPARTIRDLRRMASAMPKRIGDRRPAVAPADVRRAARQASVLGLPLGSATGRDRTRSDLERDFLRLCRRYRLPEPKVNVRVGQHLVDFLWPESQLVVETDGYRYHRGRIAFQDDHRRDFELWALGYEVIRLSEEQVAEEPAGIAERLRSHLRGKAAPRADL
ncbi:MAG TPA: type IV toxin-antitoxin system AbiEi family antitoxin domain-containing protein [Solirubrobacterales bacterium]|jgi:very-short-patch-repair endonuclease|nr:type IV toxin-antitoxin system AbiEi family antitoxin domain-containing protein [Solirubrobacterales bacterium]